MGLSQVSFSQKVYTFTGTGSWKKTTNWTNNARPPATLATGDSIIIKPNGECVLDTIQFVSKGAVFTIGEGKKFSVLGNLIQVGTIENGEGIFTDPRDGQKYPYKTIGTQIWMTKNFNYAAPGSCCYDNDLANCAMFGRLYDWSTALNTAPPGWHLPSDAEWTTLTNYLGGEAVAGGALKDTILWKSPNTGAKNSSGFSGLPGGSRYYDSYFNLGRFGQWWSSSKSGPRFAWFRDLSYNNESVGISNDVIINEYMSVRYLRD